ncbi:uncharacterized protein N7496_005572 [Penicillium cataractarum]|uniref:Endoplasmic reticulum junction formation protein lunapark n=1 Tax=Penicillium cataractarum TaxID=2100454 RepID=A0A9W9SKU1_9EURO|nr:uncharacterized protein N7496_005572 [Penicillium cataractarum]KAJ5378163.1 hypothetical protein N7496_005572 [Penicillium cataractarum]
MVSFWPWKGEDNSPASFEKTLSTLSTKIAQATTRLDQQRQTARRFKALWTLYSTFAYLFYSIVLALVLGWESWGVKEYTAIAGGPVLIYGVRTAGARLFEYRISRSQRHLDELNKQRDETIEKLKVATKYNSTQQLLEKYGGESPKTSPNPKAGPDSRKQTTPSQKQQQQQQHVARTGLPPPPTANIRRPPPGQSPIGPGNPPSPPPYQTPQQQQALPNAPSTPPLPQQFTEEPGFAPNAFPSSGQYIEQPHWYDRLLDVLLGEDEMQPRNRMAMICGSCRLVNGQAPPGIKTLEELGRWRCGSCGAWNGEESETTKMLSTLRQSSGPAEGLSGSVLTVESDGQGGDVSDEGVMVAASEEDEQGDRDSDEVNEDESDQKEEPKAEPVRRSKRGKGKQ